MTATYVPTWQGAGLCYDQPNLMDDARSAKLTCRRCPVLDACRAWVLSIPTHLGPSGVVGGTTLTQRERIQLAPLPPRQCIRCREWKPLHQFALTAEGRAARRPYCKSCPFTHLPQEGTE
jgi:hypothetical protein